MINNNISINVSDDILQYNRISSTKRRCIAKGILTNNSNNVRNRDEIVLKCNRDINILDKELAAIKRLYISCDAKNSFVIKLRYNSIVTLNNNDDDIWHALILDKGAIDIHLLGTLISQKHDTIQQYGINLFQWKLQVALKLITIINHIHDNGLCWYDVKPSNFILFLPDDIKLTGKRKEINSSKLYHYLNEKCHICAIDVGGVQENGTVIDINMIQITTKFTCPEIAYLLYNKSHNKVLVDQSTDLWSLGMTLFQLFRYDFQPMLQLSTNTHANDVLKYLALEKNSLEMEISLNTSKEFFIFDDNKNISDDNKEEVLSIIRSLLVINPSDRCPLVQVSKRIKNIL